MLHAESEQDISYKAGTAPEEYEGPEALVPAEELAAALEALLFAAGDPLPLETICLCTGFAPKDVCSCLEQLAYDYAHRPSSGLWLRQVKDAYFLASKSKYHVVCQALHKPQARTHLTQAAYEVLAVVAYNQPCTRAQVEAVRGVNSDALIARLEERGLIASCGQLEAPGRPTLFETTQQFLIEMNLRDARELPPLEMLMYAGLQDLELKLEQARQAGDTVDHLTPLREDMQTMQESVQTLPEKLTKI